MPRAVVRLLRITLAHRHAAVRYQVTVNRTRELEAKHRYFGSYPSPPPADQVQIRPRPPDGVSYTSLTRRRRDHADRRDILQDVEQQSGAWQRWRCWCPCADSRPSRTGSSPVMPARIQLPRVSLVATIGGFNPRQSLESKRMGRGRQKATTVDPQEGTAPGPDAHAMD